MTSDNQTIKYLKEITGTRDLSSVDINQREFGVHRANLIKVNLEKLDSDGWNIQIVKSGKFVDAFYIGDLVILYDELRDGYAYYNTPVNGYAWMNDDGVSWTFTIQEHFNDIQPGEKIIRMGNSTIKLTNNRITIDADEVYINGTQL
jgi:hypothetical protein